MSNFYVFRTLLWSSFICFPRNCRIVQTIGFWVKLYSFYGDWQVVQFLQWMSSIIYELPSISPQMILASLWFVRAGGASSPLLCSWRGRWPCRPRGWWHRHWIQRWWLRGWCEAGGSSRRGSLLDQQCKFCFRPIFNPHVLYHKYQRLTDNFNVILYCIYA